MTGIANLKKYMAPHQSGRAKETKPVRDMAKYGRRGDDTVAHLDTGEMIIPKSAQTPGLMALYAKNLRAKGLNPAEFQVGSGFAKRNPFTGAQEFNADPGRGDGDTGAAAEAGAEGMGGVAGGAEMGGGGEQQGDNDADYGTTAGVAGAQMDQQGLDNNTGENAGGIGGEPNALGSFAGFFHSPIETLRELELANQMLDYNERMKDVPGYNPMDPNSALDMGLAKGMSAMGLTPDPAKSSPSAVMDALTLGPLGHFIPGLSTVKSLMTVGRTLGQLNAKKEEQAALEEAGLLDEEDAMTFGDYVTAALTAPVEQIGETFGLNMELTGHDLVGQPSLEQGQFEFDPVSGALNVGLGPGMGDFGRAALDKTGLLDKQTGTVGLGTYDTNLGIADAIDDAVDYTGIGGMLDKIGSTLSTAGRSTNLSSPQGRNTGQAATDIDTSQDGGSEPREESELSEYDLYMQYLAAQQQNTPYMGYDSAGYNEQALFDMIDPYLGNNQTTDGELPEGYYFDPSYFDIYGNYTDDEEKQ